MRPPFILSSVLVIGCGPGQEPGFETEHLRFHGELDGACGSGLGVLYERELDRIAHALGRGLLEPVDVHVGYDEIDRRCPPGTSARDSLLAGCVVSDTEVATTLQALEQQLVKEIRRQHDVRGIPFIEHALPLMLGLARPTTGLVVRLWADPDFAIDEQLAYGWAEEALVDGTLALHFLHWVESAYPSQAYQAWLWSDAAVFGTCSGLWRRELEEVLTSCTCGLCLILHGQRVGLGIEVVEDLPRTLEGPPHTAARRPRVMRRTTTPHASGLLVVGRRMAQTCARLTPALSARR